MIMLYGKLWHSELRYNGGALHMHRKYQEGTEFRGLLTGSLTLEYLLCQFWLSWNPSKIGTHPHLVLIDSLLGSHFGKLLIRIEWNTGQDGKLC